MKKLLAIFFFVLLTALLFAVAVSIKEAKQLFGLNIEKTSETESKATLSQNTYLIIFAPKEQITPYFGLAKNEFGKKIALVRKDLPEDIRIFVVKHEIYHLQDNKHNGFIARELNANLAAAYYEPIGFIKAIWLTITDKTRIKYYFSRIL